MATITFGRGLKLDFLNLLVPTAVTYVDSQSFLISVADPIEDFAGSGSIYVKGSGFEYDRGRIVDGTVTKLSFMSFSGGPSFPLTIEGLDIETEDFLALYSISTLEGRLDYAFDVVLGDDDIAKGGAGDDAIYVMGGDDTVSGGAGNDLIYAGIGSDRIDGGSEKAEAAGSIAPNRFGSELFIGDVVTYATEDGPIDADLKRGTVIEGGEVDRLVDIEGIGGSRGDDTLRGDDADNVFRPNFGSDIVDGRGGVDIVTYDGSMGVSVNLTRGRAIEITGDVDRLKNVEGVLGSEANDVIVGDRGDNVLSGGLGGEDVISGKGGSDRFVFTANLGGHVTIGDFKPGDDLLVFDRSGFSLDRGIRLVVGDEPAAAGRKSIFLFDLDDRTLSVDLDGAGGNDAIEVAVLNGVRTLAITDFALI